MLTHRVLARAVFFTLAIWTVSAQIKKNGINLDIRSHGRAIADQIAANGNLAPTDEISPAPGVDVVPQIQLRGPNVQVNDGSLDNIQIFPGRRPFVKFTQSETSVAAFGRNIVVGYNSSANQPLVLIGSTLSFVHRFFSAFSNSTDGGKTWTSGFVPPVPGSIFTLGDPVVDVDRLGRFYYSGFGTDALEKVTVQVNKSTDGGRTWSDAVIVQQDDGADKDWMAVGPDPVNKNRDNVYVTWTSLQPPSAPTRTELRLGRSTDSGATWTSKTIFAPASDPDPTHPQNFLQSSNPYVDPIKGTLYIPFTHFSNSDADFLRVLISDDAGDTFRFATFNITGAPLTTVLPIVQSGEITDCGLLSGGIRLTIHSGPNQFSVFGIGRYLNASRILTQAAFAAWNGVLYLAWSNSTSPFFGDPAGHSNVLFMRSDDGGSSWTSPIHVNPTVATDIHHVMPFLSIDKDPVDVHIAYYTQHSNGMVDVDMANSHDRGATFPDNRTVRVTGTSSNLAPTNIAVTAFTATNYDRLVQPCYCLGEYLGVSSANGTVYAAWGDDRNTVTEPVNPLNPLSGLTHPQEDVFFQVVKAQ